MASDGKKCRQILPRGPPDACSVARATAPDRGTSVAPCSGRERRSRMGQQMKELQSYVNDMLAVETELHASFRRQKTDDRIKKYAAAYQLVARTEDVIDKHLDAL